MTSMPLYSSIPIAIFCSIGIMTTIKRVMNIRMARAMKRELEGNIDVAKLRRSIKNDQIVSINTGFSMHEPDVFFITIKINQEKVRLVVRNLRLDDSSGSLWQNIELIREAFELGLSDLKTRQSKDV